MQGSSDQAETHTLWGATDRPVLLTIRDVVEEIEPLATPELNDYLHPSILKVMLDDGLCWANKARIDIQWTTRDDYKFHYTDTEGMNLRWGKHPHTGYNSHVPGLEHYHPPSNANCDPDEVEESCTTQSSEELVTRAVLKLWRVAYHADSYEPLNAGRNPP